MTPTPFGFTVRDASVYRRGMSVPQGVTGSVNQVVTDSDTAIALGSGDVAVLATPRVIAWLEAAAVEALKAHIEDGQTSVGVLISIEHRAASPVGAEVSCSATVTGVDGRTVDFELQATDGGRIVAIGTHRRVIVDRAKFIEANVST